MTRTVELGAPSLTGKDANDLVSEVFADAAYPLKVVVQNHMPQDVVFPEVEGLFLRHVANAKDSQKTVVIADADLFQRLASSVEQIAELSRCELALTISEVAAADTGAPAGDSTDTAKKPSDGLTYDQLKDALKAKGIEFAANAKKADLAALLDAAPAEAATDASNGTDGAADTGANA
ncbi:HeH/LEM domain-containing protein [Comamonas nitrativorans]|uniref:HeH/LEM domain-containing protein n=1 Tax=Comamonas nitrativorans TaxID=108437 RepID=A0ABV9GU07_9BURK